MANKSGLVVLEGKWLTSSNVSVKSLFDVLVDLNFQNPHDYYFEHFADSGSLRAILRNVGPYSGARYLYIGSHGSETAFHGSAGSITRTVFRNMLGSCLASSYQGIFLGSCLFGNEETAKYLFEAVPPTVKWICGYNESVDWVESSVLDMLFWNTLFAWDRPTPSFKGTAKEKIEMTCEELQLYAPGLLGKWGFQVFMRAPGPGAGLKKLIEHKYYKT